MKNPRYYKNMFLIGAFWNLLAGLICWAGCIFMPDLFFGNFNMPVPPSLFPFHGMFSLIIALGIGYYLVSRDITKNHGLVLAGVIGKVLFFICCLVTFLLQEANFLLLLTGVVDLAFAVLFLEFLGKVKRMEQ